VSGELRESIHLPGNSWLPLQAALAIAAMCLCLIAKSYLLALLPLALSLYLLLRWSWENGAHPKAAPLSAETRREPPLHSRGFDGPGRWGMITTLLANGTLYASLLF